MSDASPQWLSTLTTSLADAGLDVTMPGSLATLTRTGLSVPLQKISRPNARLLLVGNTRQLWHRFLSDYHRAESTLPTEAEPLERYIQFHVQAALNKSATRGAPACEIFWSHRADPDYIAIVAMASAIGLTGASPAQLAIHPRYGLWLALRALIVFDDDGSDAGVMRRDPCAGCDQPCQDALATARQQSATPTATRETIAANPEPWIKVRQVCPVGREYQYSKAQSSYHYTWDRAHLVLIEKPQTGDDT
ncbi:MAG: hypothetical protein HRU17_17840 [Polyangiaceae bacterium]|nr:hypothetical protein [Polyangiaceae bacterium]